MRRCVPNYPPSFGRAIKIALALASIACVVSAQAQPVSIGEIPATSKNFISMNGQLYFSSADSLFRSGSSPGTISLVYKTNEPISSISTLINGSTFYFVTTSGSKQSLWKSNGSSAQKVGTANWILPVVIYKNELYLAIDDGITGRELWRLAGNTTLVQVKDVIPGTGSGLTHNQAVVNNNVLYFFSGGGSVDIWKTEGTAASTVMAVNLPSGTFHSLTSMGGTLYFAKEFQNYDGLMAAELWKTDGTLAGTSKIKTYSESSDVNNFSRFTVVDNKLFFIRRYITPINDLLVSDGTNLGTRTLKRVGFDGSILNMIGGDGHVAVYGETQSFPGEITASDGTRAGTEVIHQLGFNMWISPSFDYVQLTAAGNKLYFVDDSVKAPDYYTSIRERELWVSNWTAQGTRTLGSMYGTSFSDTREITASGANIFFATATSASKWRLWYYDPTVTNMCTATGTIKREQWNNISGSLVSYIPLATAPASTQMLTSFEGPVNIGDKYGDRIRGYFCAPASGAYVFSIASNDNSELYLSTSDDPSLKQKIAYVNGGTNYRQWDKYPSQKSQPIILSAGHRYYIESLHKEGVGSDHLSVAVKLPDGTFEAPMSGSHLSPFEPGVQSAVVAQSSAREGEITIEEAGLSVSPNPVRRGGTLVLHVGQSEATTTFQVISTNGALQKGGTSNSPTIDIEIDDHYAPGVYVLKGVTNTGQFVKRFVVE